MFDDDADENPLDKAKRLPLYKKANEIKDIVAVITDLIFNEKIEIDTEHDYDRILIQEYAEHMRENSTIIPAKIVGAEAMGLYDLKMENATIIRKCAREIYVNCTGLRMCKFSDVDYLQVLRNHIDDFRPMFAQWVQGFDEWDYVIDRWGLFNPPGVNYDDHDPDDDIPFNSGDSFEE